MTTGEEASSLISPVSGHSRTPVLSAESNMDDMPVPNPWSRRDHLIIESIQQILCIVFQFAVRLMIPVVIRREKTRLLWLVLRIAVKTREMPADIH